MRLNKLKKIVPALMLAAMCLSLLPIGVPVAHAQVNPTIEGGQNVNAGTGAASAAPAAGYRDPNVVDTTGCSSGVAACISNLVYFIMVGVFSSIAYICAFFFDLAVQLSLNSTTYALGFLSTSWEIVRDLSNMAFIFILIYVAIKVMLEAETNGTIKTLVLVVVVALLVNFSFFFTRVAIDAGNLLALQFYNAIEGDPIGQSAAAGVSSTLTGGQTNATNFAAPVAAYASNGQTKDLTQSIMGGLKVQNILNSESFKNYNNSAGASFMFTLISLSTIYIAVGIAFGVLAGAFLYAGAKFMMRIAGLWVIIIFSPLALVAAAIPNARGLFDLWLKQLVNFTFYPAVFLFMFFVLTRFMKELNQDGNFLSGVFATPLANNDPLGFLNILSAIANVGIRMGFVIAMMYLALSAADMLAKIRGDITTPWARAGAGWLGNAITGGAIGWTGRTAVRAGNFVSGGRLGGQGLTFDPRNIPGVRSTITPILKGYQPATKTPHGSFGATPINFGEPPSSKDAAKAAEEASKERARKAREDEFHTLLKKAAEGGTLTPVEKDRLNKADKKEIAAANEEHLVKAAKLFSEKTADKILEKEDFGKKEGFHKNWHETAGGAPLNKADDIINELEKINLTLNHPMREIADMSVAGRTINKALVNPIKDQLEEMKDIAESQHKVAITIAGQNPADPAAQRTLREATTELRNATKAFKKAESLSETLAKVPAGIGGSANAGEFTKK